MAHNEHKLPVLQSLIERCDIHALRLQTACVQMTSFSPLKPQDIATLTVEQLNIMEMLLSRLRQVAGHPWGKIVSLTIAVSGRK